MKSISEKDFENFVKVANIILQSVSPRPVIRDGNGILIKDYTPQDFYLKLQEEISEAMEKMMLYSYGDYQVSANIEKEDIAEEIADVITVCISQLEALGFDEENRSKIFARVNEKNEKRGYFNEVSD